MRGAIPPVDTFFMIWHLVKQRENFTPNFNTIKILGSICTNDTL